MLWAPQGLCHDPPWAFGSSGSKQGSTRHTVTKAQAPSLRQESRTLSPEALKSLRVVFDIPGVSAFWRLHHEHPCQCYVVVCGMISMYGLVSVLVPAWGLDMSVELVKPRLGVPLVSAPKEARELTPWRQEGGRR